MNLKIFTRVLIIGAALASIPAHAATPAASGEMTMEQLTTRLNLTPEQQAKISPYVETRRSKMQDVHSKLSANASRRDKRAALQAAKKTQDEFVRNVEPLLTAEQQAEWTKLRAEARAHMKERLSNR